MVTGSWVSSAESWVNGDEVAGSGSEVTESIRSAPASAVVSGSVGLSKGEGSSVLVSLRTVSLVEGIGVEGGPELIGGRGADNGEDCVGVSTAGVLSAGGGADLGSGSIKITFGCGGASVVGAGGAGGAGGGGMVPAVAIEAVVDAAGAESVELLELPVNHFNMSPPF